MSIDLKALRELSCAALGGPMVEWPSKWQPWWIDSRIRRSAVHALQDAFSPDVVLTLLDRLEAAENALRRIRDSRESDVSVYAEFCLQEAIAVVGDRKEQP